ncbi:UNVERIFIED_CONTAM: hypothetical protein HDU68_006204 [Siphonaria sp. JEL0065]|nr:hypothetical protein HDU68_006204 [Siphonaria sp. JEL0065]
MPKTETEICGTCGATSKYRCPGCSTRSCSLGCVTAHKKALGCTGTRERTTYVPMARYDATTQRSDFCFLEDAARVADNAARDANAKKEPVRSLSVREQHLVRCAANRRTKIRLMPKGMTRHDSNKSLFHIKSNTIIWSVEWLFSLPDGKTVTILQHELSWPLLDSVMMILIRSFTFQISVKEDGIIKDILSKSLSPLTSTIAPDLLCQVNAFTATPIDSIHVYLRRENARANEPKFYEVNLELNIKTLLQDKHLVEFPTFSVCLTTLDPKLIAVSGSKIKEDTVPVQGQEEVEGSKDDMAVDEKDETATLQHELEAKVEEEKEEEEKEVLVSEDEEGELAETVAVEDGEEEDEEKDIQPSEPEAALEKIDLLFEQLQGLITTCYTSSEPTHIKALHHKLSRLKPQLRDLLAEPPKDAAARRDLDAGKVGTKTANAKFVRNAVCLSDLLDLNETRAGTLLQHAIEVKEKYDRVEVHVAVIEYYREQLTLLECLDLLIKATNSPSVPAESRRVIEAHLADLFPAAALPSKIIQLIGTLKARMEALRDDTVYAGTQTGSQLKALSVSEELISLSCSYIAKVRLSLVGLLFSFSLFLKLSAPEVLTLLKLTQSSNAPDSLWAPLSVILISGLQSLECDVEFTPDQIKTVTDINNVLFNETSKWQNKQLLGVFVIQFGIFLKLAKPKNPLLEETLGFHESIETRITTNIAASNPFDFVKDNLISWATLENSGEGIDGEGEAEIRNGMFVVLQRFVSDFFRLMGRVVRTLKNESEDLLHVQDGEARSATCGLKQLLTLVHLLYKDRLDDGYVYWTDPDLFKFLKFMVDVRSPVILQSFLDIIASFATGTKSSLCAAEFLGSDHPKLSWVALFAILDSTAKSLALSPEKEISPLEITLQKSFLNLLKQVVRFSDIARTTLANSAQLQAINTLFNLLNRRIPVDLKACLLDVIAAFCLPVEKGTVSEVAPMVWKHLEQAEIVPKPKYTSAGVHYGAFSNNLLSGRHEGIRYDMEQIEAQNQTYPETVAFLTLLNTLLVAIKPSSLTGTIDGFSTKLPGVSNVIGINHYVHFAVEEVFLKVHNRMFISIEERWKVIELSLHLVDQSLKSFDLMYGAGSSEFDGQVMETLKQDALAVSGIENAATVMISSHPGFSIMLRLLSGSTFLQKLLEIVQADVEQINLYGRKCVALVGSLKNALRILLRALHLQQLVFDVLSVDQAATVPYLKQTPTVGGIEQHLAFAKEAVITIALFVNCEIDDEVVLLSVNLLTVLAQSPLFSSIDPAPGKYGKVNRLVSLLSSSLESNKIIAGFVHRLDLEEPENEVDLNIDWSGNGAADGAAIAALKLDAWRDPDLSILLFESTFGANRDASLSQSAGLSNLIRLAVVDLLLGNLLSRHAFPTVGHYLLGYNMNTRGKVELLEAKGQNGRRCCFHIILDLLKVGTIQTSSGGGVAAFGDGDLEVALPLFYSHPKLAERCFRLLYTVCSDQVTSAVTMRYLRTTEDFFYKQLEVMPVNCIVNVDMEEDRNVSATQLHQRSWLMQLIALELHLTTSIGQITHAKRLLDLLFISPVPDNIQSSFFAHNTIRFDQPLTKMLEVLNALDFANGERDQTARPDLMYFNDLDLTKCIVHNEYEYPLYDIRAVHTLLVTKQRSLEKHGNAAINHDRNRLKSEMTAVLQQLLERNERIENLGSRIHCIFAWSLILRTAFGVSFDLLPPESREEKSYQLLTTIFPKFNALNASGDIIEYMGPVILELMRRLQDDKAHQAMLLHSKIGVGAGGIVNRDDEKPLTALHAILKGLLDGLLRPDSTPSLRENLYSALLHYLNYTNSDEVSSSAQLVTYRTKVLLGNAKVITECGERLLEVVCRDAVTTDSVLKTTSFSVLEALYYLTSRTSAGAGGGEKENGVLGFLVRRNFLAGFISGVGKQEDVAIQSLMQSDPVPENWAQLFVFEAKMSLFLRIAQTRDGIEKLLESGLLDMLIDVKFLDDRPEADSDAMESERTKAEIAETYHSCATPIFDLLLAITSHNRENVNVIQRISLFLFNHQETFTAILKNKNALQNEFDMRELELVTCFISYLGSNRLLLETGVRGSGYTSFHNLVVSLLVYYSTLDETFGVGSGGNGGLVGAGSVVVWDPVMERHVQAVYRNLISYCEVVTGGDSGVSLDVALSLVFASNGDTGQKQERSRIPAITILKSLSKFIGQFTKSTNQCKNIKNKIELGNRLSADDIDEFAKRNSVCSTDLSTDQKRELAKIELKKEERVAAEDVLTLLQIIDGLLILTLRYFESCVGVKEGGGVDGLTDGTNNNRYMRMGATKPVVDDKEVAKLRQELNVVLDKIGGLDLARKDMYSDPDDEDEHDEEAEFLSYMQQQDPIGSESERESGNEDEEAEAASESEGSAKGSAKSRFGSSVTDKQENGELVETENDAASDGSEESSDREQDLGDDKEERTDELEEQEDHNGGLKQWELEMQDALHNTTKRYFGSEDAGKKCSFCRKPGHDPRDCKEKVQALGHQKYNCPNSSQAKNCDWCGTSSHSIFDCPHFWRKYRIKSAYTSLPTATTQKAISKLRKFCYNCASHQHFGDDCPALGYRRGFNITGFNLNNLPTVKDPSRHQQKHRPQTHHRSSPSSPSVTSPNTKRKEIDYGREEDMGLTKQEKEAIRAWEQKERESRERETRQQQQSHERDRDRRSSGGGYRDDGRNRDKDRDYGSWNGGGNGGNRGGGSKMPSYAPLSTDKHGRASPKYSNNYKKRGYE